jgi:hypothetical protein
MEATPQMAILGSKEPRDYLGESEAIDAVVAEAETMGLLGVGIVVCSRLILPEAVELVAGFLNHLRVGE